MSGQGGKTLHELMNDHYFSQEPPNSIDRQKFALDAVKGLSLEDGAATLTVFTARSVACAIQHFPTAPTARTAQPPTPLHHPPTWEKESA